MMQKKIYSSYLQYMLYHLTVATMICCTSSRSELLALPMFTEALCKLLILYSTHHWMWADASKQQQICNFMLMHWHPAMNIAWNHRLVYETLIKADWLPQVLEQGASRLWVSRELAMTPDLRFFDRWQITPNLMKQRGWRLLFAIGADYVWGSDQVTWCMVCHADWPYDNPTAIKLV